MTVTHIFWGLCVLYSPGVLFITALVPLTALSVPWSLVVIWSAALGGLLSLLYSTYSPWWLLGLIPQQILMVLAGTSSLAAVAAGQYGDGVLHPRSFIGADQGWHVILVLFHALSMLAYVTRILSAHQSNVTTVSATKDPSCL